MDVHNPSEYVLAGQKLASPAIGEEIVISGLAGRFPDSDDVHEFRDNLYAKVDMVSSDHRRWRPTHPEVPQRTGKINHIDKFDAGFFGVPNRQANVMDPMSRMLLERAFEAVLDAGINPAELKGSKTGVYAGICFSETEQSSFYEYSDRQCYGITGCMRSMIVQRISHWFQLDGPSFICDTACSSSLFAFDNAYKALREGKCEMAIVGGCNLCLHPIVSLQFARLGVLSRDGACKCFDNSANGYARSEGVAVIILQKAKNARRIYAEVLHSKTNCDGYKEQGITYPSGKVQKVLLDEFYQECGVSPSSLTYVEAHGTGTKVGDPEELGTLDEVFCTGRDRPLLIGSVKSNIGHNEPVSALCSIAKMIIGMENGFIPPNIHYVTPRVGVASLETGRLKVVSEKTPFPDDNGLIGINSFGFGGANSHLLLRWNHKKKVNWGSPRDNLPRLVCISGRTKESVDSFVRDLETRNLDAENVRMLHEIFRYDIPGHLYRGYIILSKLGTPVKRLQYYEGQSAPMHYVFGGPDKNLSVIGASLFAFPIFAAHIQRIYKFLVSSGSDLDIVEIINDYKADDIVHQMVGTVAIQTGIVELLKTLGLLPDGLMGYSIGELSAAYCDGVITIEQAVLTAYHTGIVVRSSKGIEDAAMYLTAQMKKIIPNALKSTKKWILNSSSGEAAVSVKHFTTVLLEPLMVTPSRISAPEDIVILQIGEADIPDTKSVQIVKMIDDSKSINGLLEGLGRLYQLGYNFPLEKLYPAVPWPVSRGTAMISPLIKWNHTKSLFVTSYKEQDKIKNGHRFFEVGIREDDWEFIKGHVVDKRQLFPATGYLYLVWETLSMMVDKLVTNMKVVFDNVKFIRACTVPTKGKVDIYVMIQKSSGNFEIVEGSSIVATGTVSQCNDINKHWLDLPVPAEPYDSSEISLSSRDVYKELGLRGYNYKDAFRAVTNCNISVTKGMIRWTGNWISFMDNMLQLQILQEDTRNLYVPTRIGKVLIDAKKHQAFIDKFKDIGESTDDPNVPVYVYKHLNIIRSGGIEIRGMWANSIVKRKQTEPVLETYKFMPFDGSVDLQNSVRIMMQVALENEPSVKLKVVEQFDDPEKEVLCPYLQAALRDLPLIQPELMVLSKTAMDIPDVIVENRKITTESDCYWVIVTNVLEQTELHVTLLASIKPEGFILSREALTIDPYALKLNDIMIISTSKTQAEQLVLLKRRTTPKPPTYIPIRSDEFFWLADAQKAMHSDSDLIFYTQNEPESGILGFVNCIRREPGGSKVRCLFLDHTAPEFEPKSRFYEGQLAKGLAVNVFKNGSWGTYRHLALDLNLEVETEHCYVNVTMRGDLSSLRWIEGPLNSRSVLGPDESLVYVHCAAINFRDIMTASGRIQSDVITRNRLEQDCVQGFEFAGVDRLGRRVMGMITRNAMATLVPANANLLWRVPDSWSMEEAATIPTVYGTVIWGLILRANLKHGQSVLIHSATGGVGQAALNIALHYGCTVFATVGTQEKRDFLKHHYPQIKQSNIGNSRDTSFEQMVMKETNGRGVDIVLNSLADEKLMASVRCLAYGGQFLEIGKFDLAADTQLPMDLFAKEAEFHGIMLDHLFSKDPVINGPLVDSITRGVKEGWIKPLPLTCFKSDEIEQAFRFMSTGKHIGKVLIRVREETRGIPQVVKFKAIPRFFCNPNNSYIIIGGLGGFGLELADWLILRGARKLVLTSRNGVTTGYQTLRLNTWKSYGASILVLNHDVTTSSGVRSLLQEASDFGQVEAIFNLAVVLRDALFENQTAEDYKISLDPKATATKHLDTISRILCPNLQYFVVFSSVSCGRGNAGQTNYGMANSVMERICEKRRQDNLPALAIQWGAVGDVGLLAELQENDTEMVIGGTLQQKISSCLEAMDKFLRQPETIVGSMVVAEKRSGTYKADNVLEAVVNALGLRDLKTVSLHSTFPELGMDSMMAVEIKQTLEREYEVFLSPQDIRSMTLARLQVIAEERTTDKEPESKKDDLHVGVRQLLRFIAKEDEADVHLVKLPTLLQPMVDAKTVILLPGIEGTAITYEPLAKNLSLHAACVQFLYSNPEETINKMAENIIPIIESHISKSGHFYLIGHSFGTAVAIEVAAILERNGYTGELVLIDGSPALIKHFIEAQFEVATEAKFQTNLLCGLLSVYMPLETIATHKITLFNCKSFEERIKYLLSIAPKHLPHNHNYLKKVCIATYVRLKAMHTYQPSFEKLRSPVILCRPTISSVTDIAEDYMLSKLIGRPVQVKFFDGDHLSMLENKALAEEIYAIVNGRDEYKKTVVTAVEANVVKHTVE